MYFKINSPYNDFFFTSYNSTPVIVQFIKYFIQEDFSRHETASDVNI